jgi:hypothetical protein
MPKRITASLLLSPPYVVLDNLRQRLCGIGSWGGQRTRVWHLMSGGYEPKGGVTAAGGRSCCLSSRRCPQSYSLCSGIPVASFLEEATPQADLKQPSLTLKLQKLLLVPDVGRHGHNLCEPLSDQLGVDHHVTHEHVG